jgi:polysaccharide export outer membrane protein
MNSARVGHGVSVSEVSMRSTTVLLGCLAALTGFLVLPASAQPAGDNTDKLRLWREQQEQYWQAQKEMLKKQFSTGGSQKDLERLTERKNTIDKEIVYYRSKFTSSGRLLTGAEKAGNAAEIEKWGREVQAWSTKLKASENELAQVEAEIQTVIEKIQKEALEPTQSNLILPGDALQIFVVEDESFNGIYQVRRGGYIILPRVGRVPVVGKDLPAAEKAVKDALEASQLRQGTVMIERTRASVEEESSDVIYLAGEFTTPGPMKIPQGYSPTIVTLILRSGGVSPSADLTHVKLLRLENGKALVEEVNVQAILDGSGLPSDLALNPGDIVVVPAFSPIVYVTGNVKNPGILKLFQDEELTAYSAILRSGGFARFANLKRVYVVRDHGNGEKSKIPVNLKDVQAGRTPDVVLRGRDIVVVPESFFSW